MPTGLTAHGPQGSQDSTDLSLHPSAPAQSYSSCSVLTPLAFALTPPLTLGLPSTLGKVPTNTHYTLLSLPLALTWAQLFLSRPPHLSVVNSPVLLLPTSGAVLCPNSEPMNILLWLLEEEQLIQKGRWAISIYTVDSTRLLCKITVCLKEQTIFFLTFLKSEIQHQG